MRPSLRLPMRLKFMLTLLVLVTAVIGVITFSTATMFQDDKKAYVNGLTSMVAVGMAEEARSTLAGYRERLDLYTGLIMKGAASNEEDLTRILFDEFPELIAILVQSGDEEPLGVHNLSALESIGWTPEDVREFARDHPVPERFLEDGRSYVRNAPIASESSTLLFSFAESAPDGPPVLISALLRSERLQQLVTRFSAYDQFLVDSEGRYLAHSNIAVLKRDMAARLDETDHLRDEFSAGMTVEFDSGGTEMIGAYARVDLGGVIAGAEIPSSAANYASRRVVSRLLLLAGLLLVAALVASVIWAHRITRPMERLSEATRAIAGGRFDVAVEVESSDEMGDLASSFNHMAGELTARERALTEAHAQLVQSEKMAAFGQFGAGIAHEVKNPLAGILACAQLAADEVPEGSTVFADLKLIEKESKRCKAIIENLLKFARQEKSEMTPINVNDVIQDSMAIVNHQLELNEVRIETDLQGDLPQIYGNANQLQQVFVNLAINAQQAMEGTPGRFSIVSRRDGDVVQLRFSDTGPGIPEEIQASIFEPFFTTKPTGKGTGLGLSVSYGIIQDHTGVILIESEIGRGTTFAISLPACHVGAVDSDSAAPPAVSVIETATPVG